MSDAQRMPFEPSLPDDSDAPAMFLAFARRLADVPEFESDQERNAAIEAFRRQAVKEKNKCDAAGRQPLLAAMHVLADLAKQGWSVVVSSGEVEISRDENGVAQGEEARERVRGQLHAERDEQLRQPAVAGFVKSMEVKQLFNNRFMSIYSLMRDGQELAVRLREVSRGRRRRTPGTRQPGHPTLPAIHPQRGRACPWTDLRLMDIWRYFRHTWASPYKTVPGRTMMVLVRDAAVPFHPVAGIAALSSAAVAVTVRDEKIGWTADSVIEEMRERPTARLATWLRKTVDDAVDEIYKVDLLEDKILRLRDLERPTDEMLRVLREEGKRRRREHHRFMESGAYKKAEPADSLPEEHWEAQARWPLFRSKRALELANLLSVRMALRRLSAGAPSRAALTELVGDGAGRDAVAKIVRKAKADRVGTAMADLTICGAVPPYNEVLGGKLVAMLMVSPEVVTEYRRRYEGLPSVIASSMAGRSIRRPADLVFIGTTSLYGQRPSQYDRISIPRDPESPDQRPGLRYEYLGRTRGIGTFQFNDRTVAELAVLLAQSKRGQQVNSVFGEGVNPRLRKIRDGLDALGLSSDDLLNHGGPRLVYGVELTENTRAYLLGMDKHPRYILGQRSPKQRTHEIARWWLRRWLLPRIDREDILARAAGHNFVQPVRHGARVQLPKEDLY